MDLIERAESIFSRLNAVGFDALSVPEQHFVAVWALEADVNNGGFDQYFFNSSGDFAFVVVEALRAIGADRAAAIVQEAVDVFGPAGPARDHSARQEALDAAGALAQARLEELDERFYAYPDDIGGLLAAYVERHGLADVP